LRKRAFGWRVVYQAIAAMASMTNEARPISVLLVEDEFLISEMVADCLSQQGFSVAVVTNGADALRHLVSAPIDVLFTDINLPGGMDGTTLARRARELLPDLPVVYASGGVNMFDFTWRVPRSIFVAKPYDPDAVGRLLASASKATAVRLHA
jgi:CheY-like chemotaxis protein